MAWTALRDGDRHKARELLDGFWTDNSAVTPVDAAAPWGAATRIRKAIKLEAFVNVATAGLRRSIRRSPISMEGPAIIGQRCLAFFTHQREIGWKIPDHAVIDLHQSIVVDRDGPSKAWIGHQVLRHHPGETVRATAISPRVEPEAVR